MSVELSICIPTFNWARFLKDTLDSIVNETVFQEADKVEIVLSDNCSTDETPEVCAEFVQRFHDKIRYERLETPISGDENFSKVLARGNGTFLKLHNDKLLVKTGGLGKLI